MESLKLNYFNSFIEEAWIIRGGICVFHECWVEFPLDLNVQLFSAFTSAVNSFSKTTLPSETLRNIDFQNTTLVLENLPEFDLLFVIKFASISSDKQFEITNALINEFLIYVNEFNLMELFSISNTKAIPISVYTQALTRFLNYFLTTLAQNEAEIRKIDLLGVVQLSASLFNIVVKSKADLGVLKANTSHDNIFKKILLGSSSVYLSTDSLPGMSRRELKGQFSEYIKNLSLIIDNHLDEDMERKIFKFYINNFQLIKSFNLDEELVINLLSNIANNG